MSAGIPPTRGTDDSSATLTAPRPGRWSRTRWGAWTDLVPDPSHETLVQALRGSQRELHAWGITAWHDPGVNPEWLPVYRELAANGRLTARVVAAQQWQPWGQEREADPLPRLLEGRDGSRFERLRSDVVKFFLDGVFETQTAYLLEPYLRADGTRNRPRATGLRAGRAERRGDRARTPGIRCAFPRHWRRRGPTGP